jgi:hypothetical protein
MRAAKSATASTAVPTNPDPDADLAAVKARARRAYLDAKRKGAAPPAICDKLHADCLLALRRRATASSGCHGISHGTSIRAAN